MTDRNAEFASQQHRGSICRATKAMEAVDFFNVLAGPELLETTEAYLPEHRERLYPPTVTLSMFMMQALNEDGSCQKAINGWAARRAAEGLKANSIHTGGYCRARQRLPVEMVRALTRQTGELLSARALGGWRWRGRVVKLVDGTGISMPDTQQIVEDMNTPGLALHPLKGDRKGTWSVKVQANWRITFRFENGNAKVVNYEDYH